MEKEATLVATRVAVAMIKATKKEADGAKAGRARRIDPAYARRVFYELMNSNDPEALERLPSGGEFVRILMAVPEIRAEYHRQLRKKKAGK